MGKISNSVVKDSFIFNLVRNSLLYLTGFSLYLLTYGYFNLIKTIIGLLSFIITYNSIYYYNDLMDYESDKKNKFKRKYKALTRGDITINDAITIMFSSIIVGLMLSVFVNQWFTILLLFLLLQNFLHSSPITTRLFKHNRKVMIVNMFLMQFIKISLGWFALTSNTTLMPSWIIATISLAYVWSYFFYKKGIHQIKKTFKQYKKTALFLSITTIASYFISLIIYPFKIPLIALPIILILLVLKRNISNNQVNRTFKLMGVTFIVLLIMNLLFLLLTVPIIERVNNETQAIFSKVGNVTLRIVDNNTYEAICIINNSLYSYPIKDLNNFNKLLNFSNGELVIRVK